VEKEDDVRIACAIEVIELVRGPCELKRIRGDVGIDRDRKEIAEGSGISNEEVLKTLQELGYTRDTVLLLHLVPLISVAWADEKVSGPERELILEAAKLRNIAEDGAAFKQLSDWLTNRPSDEFLEQTLRVIRSLADTNAPGETETRRQNLLELCTRVAEASGGILGLGKISDEEQAMIDRIAKQLEK